MSEKVMARNLSQQEPGRGKRHATATCVMTGRLDRARSRDRPRHERMVERVHSLGPRPLAELLAEIAAVTGQHVRVVDLVEEYAALDPAVLRAVGADHFPPMPPGVVW